MKIGARPTLRLAAVSVVARVPAFLIPLAIAALFGAGTETDLYFLAYSVVLFLGGTLAQGGEQAIVPFAAREIQLVGGSPRRYLDRAAVRMLLAGAVIWGMGVFVVALVTEPALRRGWLQYAVYFTPLAVFWCGTSPYAGALVSQWRIASATGSLLLRGAGALLGLAIVPLGGGLWAVALGLGVGELARFWWLRKQLWADVPVSDSHQTPSITQYTQAAAAQALAGGVIGVALVVERLLAVSLGIGSLSHLEYALRLLVIPGVLFEGAIAPMLLARWTQAINVNLATPTTKDVLRTVGKGMVVAVSCAVILAIAAPLVVELILGHGRFDKVDEVAVSTLLRFLSLGFVGTMGALMMERYYLACSRNRLLAGLSTGRAIVRIAVVLWLLPTKGLLAYAFAYAMADWVYLIALATLLRSTSPVRPAGRAF